MYKIEKNIPLPKEKEPPQRESIAPWEDFELGDSVFLPYYANREIPNFTQFNISVLNKRFTDRKFTTRRVVSGGIPGLRVWRTS